MGTAQRLKEENPNLKIFGVVATKDDYIPGIRTQDEALEVGLFKPDYYHDIVYIDSSRALELMQQLMRRAGLLAGPTTGAALAGLIESLIEIDKTLDSPKTAVFIACDRMEWYTSYIHERRPEWFGSKPTSSWRDTLTIDNSHDISPREIKSWIAQHQPLIIDVRQPLSYSVARISGSINMPFDMLNAMFQTSIPFGNQQTILAVCPTGEKSRLITSYLRSKGLKAYNLDEGITGWRDHGLPLERAGEEDAGA